MKILTADASLQDLLLGPLSDRFWVTSTINKDSHIYTSIVSLFNVLVILTVAASENGGFGGGLRRLWEHFVLLIPVYHKYHYDLNICS